MGTIHIDDIGLGMRLANDLRGANGRFLLPKGTEIEDKHLRILKIWGVTQIEIEGVANSAYSSEEDFTPEVLRQSIELIGDLFRLSNTDFPPMREIKRLALRKTAERLAAGCPPGSNATESETASPEATQEQGWPGSAAELASAEVELCSFPDIYFQITEVLNNPSSTASHVADVVSKDASLSAKLLKLVNSPFYGFPSKVDSIPRAVALVGSNELSMLALGVSVVEYFVDVPHDLMDMRNFWMHSIACGVFSHTLAGHMAGLSEERFFLGGLIHDIGRLVILKNSPLAAATSLNLARSGPCLLYEAEREVLGFDHASVASHLMTLWQFPGSLEEMVAYHHIPEHASQMLDASIVHCADILARSIWTGYKGLFYVPPMQTAAWEALDMEPSVLPSVLNHGERLIQEIYNTFLGKH